ncbi:hypothetical protein [Streptomyces sp. NRRL F-4489]|uniref:hypothetical protein n=1 Tax=Streptomyces sp. NRRL F-4489 TaxID=1609095 RepID=UPI000AEA7923|nr:hypothetical protein [Streptomyces sp. NRRL F-4489]
MSGQTKIVYAAGNGVPEGVAFPTGTPSREGGLLMIMALAIAPEVPRDELNDFLKRHHFVPRTETARAADSQARWTLEKDSSVRLSFTSEEGLAQLVIPTYPSLRHWATMAVMYGGTVSLMVLPDMPSPDLNSVGRRISPGGTGEYWHLSMANLRA